jgi:hypothetical protein
MSFKSTMKSYGFHVTQTTQSLTGGLFSKTTKTPTTPFENKVRPDGIEREKLEEMRQKTGQKDSASAHIRYNFDNLKENVAGLVHQHEWWNILKDDQKALFPKSNSNHLENFEKQMSFVAGRLPASLVTTPDAKANPRDARVLPGTTMTVLLNAASTACSLDGMTADDAANAIACLHHINLVDAIRNPFDGPGAVPANNANAEPKRRDGLAFTEADLSNAWRLAIELERCGEAGFNLLKHLTQQTAAPGHAVHATVARQRDALLHTYLQAAREKVQEVDKGRHEPALPAALDHGKLKPDPLSIHTHINRKIGGANVAANTEPGANPNDNVHVVGNRIGGRVFANPTGNRATDASLLDKALKAVSNHMEQVETHAANANNAGKQITFDQNAGDIRKGTNANTYVVLNKDGNWWAANLVRSGVYSEDSKQYRKMQNRAAKMTDWLHRANNDNTAVPLTKTQRTLRRVKQAVLPFKNKSPFHTYNNVVPTSPHRLLGGSDASGISDGQSIRQDLIWNVIKGIEQFGVPPAGNGAQRTALRSGQYPGDHAVVAKRNQPAVPDNPSPQVLTQMVRLAILQQQSRFNSKTNGVNLFITRHAEGHVLDEDDLKRAKQTVYEMFVGGEAAQNPEKKWAIDAIFTEQNKQLSPERLIDWATDVGMPPAIREAKNLKVETVADRNANVEEAIRAFKANPPPAPANVSQPDWDQFVDGVYRDLLGRVKEYTNAGRDLSGLTDTQAAALFEDIVSRQKLGHLIEMKDGGSAGIKTQGLSYIISRVLLAPLTWKWGTVGVGVDLRRLKAKHAVISWGTGTGGRDMFVGTAKADRKQAGIGSTVGPGHVSKKADGWSVGLAAGGNFTPYNHEWSERVGNMFRFRRVFSGVDSDDIGNAQLGRLTRKLMDPGTAPVNNEGGPWIDPADGNDTDILKRIMHEFDDVSLSWVKSKERTFKESLSGAVTAGFKVGAWGPGAGVGAGIELSQSKTTWREEGGSLNQQRDIKASEFKGNLSGLMTLVATTIKELNLGDSQMARNLQDPAFWSGAFKQSFQDGVMASADVYRTGTSRRHTWIYHDGALTYTPGICSFYQKTHKNAAAFVHSIGSRLNALTTDKAKVFEQPKVYHSGEAAPTPDVAGAQRNENEEIIKTEKKRMLEDLHQILMNAKPTQEFREYFEWSPKFLQMINDLESAIRSEKAKPDWEKHKGAKNRVRHYEKQLAKLKALDDETVRLHGEYRFNITDNVEGKQKNLGLNAPLVNQHEGFFGARRIDIYT